MLPEGTLTFIPSAYSETDTLFCRSTRLVCHIYTYTKYIHMCVAFVCVCVYVLNNVGRNRLPWGTPPNFRELLWRISI